jgi:hypothetical protein
MIALLLFDRKTMLKIFTYTSNRAEHIDLQMKSFQKYLQEEFTFTVFNNATFGYDARVDYNREKIQIDETCRRLGISVIDIQKDPGLIAELQSITSWGPLFSTRGQYSNANFAHAYALCWTWKHIISKERGPVAILDSDVFLIQPIKLTDLLYQHDISNVLEGKTHPDGRCFRYLWPAIVLLNMAKLPEPETMNWFCGQIEGVPVDVGGHTHHYLQAHPELDLHVISKRHFWIVDSLDFSPADYEEFYLNGLDNEAPVLHYRSGSNWNNQTKEYHQKKTEWLKGRIG